MEQIKINKLSIAKSVIAQSDEDYESELAIFSDELIENIKACAGFLIIMEEGSENTYSFKIDDVNRFNTTGHPSLLRKVFNYLDTLGYNPGALSISPTVWYIKKK